MILKRLLTVCAALTLAFGATVQPVPSGIAAPQTAISADMTRGYSGPQPPCTGLMPNCVDHGGCICVSVLPTSPAADAVPVEWTSLEYHLASQMLAGISVKPELSPPILTV